jgi:hypothetical protein
VTGRQGEEGTGRGLGDWGIGRLGDLGIWRLEESSEISGISWPGYIEMSGIKVGCFGENCKENQLDSWTVPTESGSALRFDWRLDKKFNSHEVTKDNSPVRQCWVKNE